MIPTKQTERIVVWDPVVRYGHWALVAAFAVAYLSAEEEATGSPDLLHVWCGYAVGIIVALRVIWGFVGPRSARFSDFVYGPLTVLRYFTDLVRGHARRYLGHSPAGGMMVIALLVCLAGTVGTGLVAYGERGKGPLAGVVGGPIAHASAASAQAPENGKAEREESPLDELHGALANITLALVILHVLGVGLASVAHKENLVMAMITGEKRTGD